MTCFKFVFEFDMRCWKKAWLLFTEWLALGCYEFEPLLLLPVGVPMRKAVGLSTLAMLI